MDMIKTYSGSISDISSTKTIKPCYGVDSTSTVKKEHTELLNSKLVEFLTECGVDAQYDGNYLWVNGYPICFYFQQVYYLYSPPFLNKPNGGSSYTTIFDSNGKYNFRLRLFGNPKIAFTLLISGNITSLAFNSVGIFKFVKGINIMNGRQGRLFTDGASYSGLYAIELDEDGTPIDTGHASSRITFNDINSLAVDFTNNVNIIPLVDLIVGIYKLSGCYMNLRNDSFPKPASLYADAQVFLKINNEIYCRDYSLGFIKC